jgi:hypothetical protein
MIFRRRATNTEQVRATPPASGSPISARRRALLAATACVATAAAAGGAMMPSVAFAGATPATAGATLASTHAAPQAGTKDAAARTRSGLPWASGAYLPSDTPAAAAAFGRWRGRPLDVVDNWSNEATWPDIVDPAWLYQRWRRSPYTLAFGVAMLPQHVRGVSLNACANGRYNSYWRQFGRVISSYGLGTSIIRLGWEFNGAWYIWKATQPATWVGCWQQIVTSARSYAPGLRWDWNVNRGVTSALANPALAYPGNSYVTMVGIDSYDWWPSARTAAGWQRQLNGPQGLDYWLAFAERHGKLLSVPEWGSVAGRASAGGDDPLYVRDMRAFFEANAAHLAFEANFQGVPGIEGSYGAGTMVPHAAAAYRAGF